MRRIAVILSSLILVGAVITISLLFFERSMTREAPMQLETPKVTPRAQSEFESGEIFKAYKQASEAELATDPPLEKIFVWMLKNSKEALK